jgi:hypothetical protein
MDQTNQRLVERIKAYAFRLQVQSSAVVSLKLRPVEPCDHSDLFGEEASNAYMYESEYEAGRSVANLVTPFGMTTSEIGTKVHHPNIASDAGTYIRTFRNTRPQVLWIEHETGLEILGVIGTVIGIVSGGITIWNAIRNKIANNKAGRSDRYYTDVSEIRFESRRVSDDGELVQTLVYRVPLSESIDPELLHKNLVKCLQATGIQE